MGPAEIVVLKTPAQLILEEVAQRHGLTVKELKGGGREFKYSHPRQEAIYLLRTNIMVHGKPLGYPTIARMLGLKDHTTAMHGFKKHRARIEKIGFEDPERSALRAENKKEIGC